MEAIEIGVMELRQNFERDNYQTPKTDSVKKVELEEEIAIRD